jgi:hypothetical protein
MTSRKDRSPAAYADVKFIMDIAVEKDGLQYHLKSSGAAVNFKQRCNKYRNLIREMVGETLNNTPGVRPETAYDILVIHQVGPDLEPSRTGAILVFSHQQILGILIDPETGKEIEIAGVTNVIKEY